MKKKIIHEKKRKNTTRSRRGHGMITVRSRIGHAPGSKSLFPLYFLERINKLIQIKKNITVL